MRIDGAVVKEQGVTFAIIVVKSYVLRNKTKRDNIRKQSRSVFPGMPIILMAQNSKGVPTYQGRKDIVRFLSNINPARIPWKRYTI